MNAKTPDNLQSHQVSSPVEKEATGNWKDPKRYMWLLGPALPGIGLAALFPPWTALLVKIRATLRNRR